MSDLGMLTADERALAKRYNLMKYFKQNKKYLLFVSEIKRILDGRFDEITKTEGVRNECAGLAQVVLERSDDLFNYINNIHAGQKEFKNVTTEDWKRICNVSSKILVHMGWEYDKTK